MLPKKILKNRVSFKCHFQHFGVGFYALSISDKEKKILRILVKQNMDRKIAWILSKIARIINISD